MIFVSILFNFDFFVASVQCMERMNDLAASMWEIILSRAACKEVKDAANVVTLCQRRPVLASASPPVHCSWLQIIKTEAVFSILMTLLRVFLPSDGLII